MTEVQINQLLFQILSLTIFTLKLIITITKSHYLPLTTMRYSIKRDTDVKPKKFREPIRWLYEQGKKRTRRTGRRLFLGYARFDPKNARRIIN